MGKENYKMADTEKVTDTPGETPAQAVEGSELVAFEVLLAELKAIKRDGTEVAHLGLEVVRERLERRRKA
jgi:hypothetical protein